MKILSIPSRRESLFLKIITLVETVIFLGMGLFFVLLYTQKVSGSMGLSFTNGNGLVDYKAIYGGLHLGLGAFMLIFLYRRNYTPVILLVFTVTCGLAFVRAMSMFTDHVFSRTMFILLGIEIGGAFINGLLLFRRDNRP